MSYCSDEDLDKLLHRLFAKDNGDALEDDEAFYESLRTVENESDGSGLGRVNAEDADRLERLFRADNSVEVQPPTPAPPSMSAWAMPALLATSMFAVVFMLISTTQLRDPNARRAAPTGEIAVNVYPKRLRTRSTQDNGLARITPATRLRFEFQQKLEKVTIPAHFVEPYLVESDGRLRSVEMKVGAEKNRQLVTLFAEGKAADVFGLVPGERRMVFAFAGPAGIPLSLDGMPWRQVANEPGVRTELVTIHYESASAASVHNYARIVSVDGRRLRVFDRKHLPVVRLRSSAERPLSLRLQWDDASTLDIPVEVERRGDWTLVKMTKSDFQVGREGLLTLLDGQNVLQKWRIGWMKSPAQYEDITQVQALIKEKKIEQATAQLERLIDSTDDGALKFFALVERGRIDFRAGRLTDAGRWWTTAGNEADRLGWLTDVSARLRGRAYLALRSKTFRDAQPLIERAWKIDIELGHEAGMARAAYLSALLQQRGSGERLFLKAWRLYDWALNSSISRGKESDIQLFSAVAATLLADHGMYDEATRLLERHEPSKNNSARYIEHHLHRLYVEVSRAGRGLAGQPQEDTGAARELLALARENGEGDQRAFLLVLLARRALLRDDLGTAEAYRRELSSLGTVAMTATPWRMTLLDAELDIARGALEKAHRSLLQLEQTVLNSNSGAPTEVSVTAIYLQALIHVRQKRRAAAVATMKRALQTRNELANRRRSLPARGAYLGRRAHVQRELLGLLMEANRSREAFELAQTLRASELETIRHQVLDVADEWPLTFDAYADYISCAGVSAEQRGDECKMAAQAVPRQLERLMLDDPPPALPSPHPGVDIEQVQSRLRPNDVLLAVSRLKDKWASFLVSPNGFESAVSDDPLRVLRAEFHEPGHVFVVPDGSRRAYNLGFDQDSAELEKTVSLLPHAGLVRYRVETQPKGDWLVVSNPNGDLLTVFAEDLGATEPASQLLVGEDATRRNVLASLRGASALHFSGHGFAVANSPWRSHLVLARDEKLGIADFFTNEMNLSFAFLAGCDTGLQGDRSVIGIPHALLATGTCSVVASVEKIDDAEALSYSRAFYIADGLRAPARSQQKLRGHAASGSFRLWGCP